MTLNDYLICAGMALMVLMLPLSGYLMAIIEEKVAKNKIKK